MKRYLSVRQITANFDAFGTDLVVVTVDKNDPEKRATVYSGLNMHAVFREMIRLNACGVRFVVCRESDMVGRKGWPGVMHPYVTAAAKFSIPYSFGSRR